MKVSKSSRSVIAVLSCLAACVFACLQTVDAGVDRNKEPDVWLATALELSGFSPEVNRSEDGKRKYFTLDFEEDSFCYHFTMSLDSHSGRLWFSAKLPTNADMRKAPAARLLALLEANAAIAPAAFTFDHSRQALSTLR